ncbi:MAG: sugar hydrolase [Catenulispora sp.]|nr:sugar hydrolase [Catenulispora sp.]
MALPKPIRLWGLSFVTAAVVAAGAVAAFTAGAAGSGTITARYAKTADWGTGSAPASTTAPPSTTTPPPTAAAPSPNTPPTGTSTVPPPSPASAPNSSAYKFAPYVDTTQRQDLGALASAAGVKYLTAGFVLSDNGCTPAWNGSSEDPAFTARLKAGLSDLRAQGGDAIASFGGANGTELALACPDETSLKAAYRTVIDEYDLTHLDFDIEGTASANQPSTTRRWQALAQLQSDYAAAGKTLDISLTLPVLPSGLTPQGVDVVSTATATGLKLSVVNIMAMDYGDWAAPNPANRMGFFAEQAAQSLHAQLKPLYPATPDPQLWAMIGITPMIGPNDTAGETFQLADAQTLTRFATQHHLGRLAMWSLPRDANSAYEFSHTFEAFTG